jgi:hypothetical protein
MLKDSWVDKIDGVDVNSAEDINAVAHAVIDLENGGGGGTGENGATFYPHVSKDGTLSWTNDKNLSNPETINIMGEKGEKGDAFTFDDFTPEQLEALKGEKGEKGEQGQQGEQGIQGEKGDPGADGQDGAIGPQGPKGDTGEKGEKGEPFTYDDFTAEQLASLKGEKGDAGEDGQNGSDGKTPVKGVDYYTEADKQELITEIALKLPKFNVKSFGATGNGATDDAVAIQKAIDACNSAGGGIVYFPVGIYLIKSCLYYYSNMILLFEQGAMLLRGSAALQYLLANDIANTVTGYNGTHDVRIIGATFDGNSAYSTTAHNDNKCTLLNTGHAKNISVEYCTFKNGNVWHFYEVCGSENVKIINCIFDGGNYSGVTSQQDGYSELLQFDNDVIISGTYSYGATKNGTSGDLTPCKNIHVKGCKFICNGYTNAIGNHNAQSKNHSLIRISDCFFMGGGGTGGYIDFDASTREVDIYNNTFDGQAVRVSASNSKITVHDNRIENSATPYTGDLVAYCNLVSGVLDGASSSDVVESISFSTFATARSGDSTYGYATFASADIKKYRGRIMGEIKFNAVTTNSNNAVLPMIVNEGYRPKVTAGITSEENGLVGIGYISAPNGNTRVSFNTKLSNKNNIAFRFDYAI